MIPEIRSIFALDVDEWPKWSPSRDMDEYQCLYVVLSFQGETGSDDFQTLVASPRGLAANGLSIDSFTGFVIEPFSTKAAENTIRSHISVLDTQSMQELASKLYPLFTWEFGPSAP